MKSEVVWKGRGKEGVGHAMEEKQRRK